MINYLRGTVLRWSEKAVRRLDVDPAERLLVLNENTVLLYRGRQVLASQMYKTQDSYVERTDETLPRGLRYSARKDQSAGSRGLLTKLHRKHIDQLISKFGLIERI